MVQNSMKNSGPLSGAAKATNFPTSRMAWQRAHLLLLKIGLEDRDLIWLTALARRAPEEATGGRGWGSTVLLSGIWFGSVSDNGKTLCYYCMKLLKLSTPKQRRWRNSYGVRNNRLHLCRRRSWWVVVLFVDRCGESAWCSKRRRRYWLW